MKSREPTVICLTSALPQFSLGGMVRRPFLAISPRRRPGAFALRQEHHSAARPQLAFALGPSCELLMRGRKACRTHEGAVGNADTWNRRRCRPLLRQIPMYQVGMIEEVVQEPDTGHETRPGMPLRNYVEIFDLEQIAHSGSLDEDGTGKRVDDPRVHLQQISGRCSRPDLSVGGVTRLDGDLLHRTDFDHRRNVRMPAVVALAVIIFERFGAIDVDAL